MNIQKVIKNLQQDVYCRVKCSKIHGVGVFAIKDIPKGINPFKITKKGDKSVGILDKDIEKLNPEVKQMIHDFFQKEKDNKWYIPVSGLNSIDVSFYMNHSSKPNIKVTEGKESFVTFKSLKLIRKGEELTINYET